MLHPEYLGETDEDDWGQEVVALVKRLMEFELVIQGGPRVWLIEAFDDETVGLAMRDLEQLHGEIAIGLYDRATDKSISLLQSLRRIVALTIANSHFSNSVFKLLGGFRELRQLTIAGIAAKIGSAEIQPLTELPHLEELSLLEIELSDDAPDCLRRLVTLRKIELEQVKMSIKFVIVHTQSNCFRGKSVSEGKLVSV